MRRDESGVRSDGERNAGRLQPVYVHQFCHCLELRIAGDDRCVVSDGGFNPFVPLFAFEVGQGGVRIEQSENR